MSWEQLPEDANLWRRIGTIATQDAWLYVNESEGAYVRVTLNQDIDASVIGSALLFEEHGSPELVTGSATMQGARPKQEDRVWVQEADFLPYCSSQSAHLMVADGHVGDCAAEFAIRTLPRAARLKLQEAIATWVLQSNKTTDIENIDPSAGCQEVPTETPPPSPADEDSHYLTASKKRWRDNGSNNSDTSPLSKCRRKFDSAVCQDNDTKCSKELRALLTKAMTDSYAEVDADFLRLNKTSKAGSTCSSLTILGRIGIFANIGDSRILRVDYPSLAAHCRPKQGRGQISRMSIDDKPGFDDERTRIEKAGGTVRRIGGCWRVLPDLESGVRAGVALAVSRSFGDRMLKKYVISKPHVTILQLRPDVDAAIIIATDGVWDTVDDQMAADLIHPFYETRDADTAARTLIKVAYQTGSEVLNLYSLYKTSSLGQH